MTANLDTSLIIQSQDDGVLSLSLNRPLKKNALTTQMYSVLAQAINQAANDTGIRVVVLSAQGGDYCSGNDILDFAQNNLGASDIIETPVFHFLKSITYFPKPLIACVQGQAVGIGTTMLLHCDMVIASVDARLSVPFIKLGLTPEGGSSVLLPKIMGHQRAFEYLAMGKVLNAQDALSLGLINSVVGIEALPSTTMALAQKLASTSLSSLMHAKALMKDPDALWDIIVKEGHIFRKQLQSPEAMAAFTAFMKK